MPASLSARDIATLAASGDGAKAVKTLLDALLDLGNDARAKLITTVLLGREAIDDLALVLRRAENSVLAWANIANATTAGQLKTQTTVPYRIAGAIYNKASTDDLWDLSGETDTSGSEYRAYWLYLDGAGSASIGAGANAASSDAAIAALPVIDTTKSVIGVFVAGLSCDFDDAGGLSSQGTISHGFAGGLTLDAEGGSLVSYHKDYAAAVYDTLEAVPRASTLDVATTVALANALKVAYNLHIADAAAAGDNSDYVHAAADAANPVAAADATDQATSETLLNELKTDFNLHLAQATVHYVDDTTNTVAAAAASDAATAVTLANELKVDLLAHMRGVLVPVEPAAT